MDVFLEQLVKIKQTALHYFLMALSLLITAGISVALFWLGGQYPILLVAIVALVYGEWRLLGVFYREYEYIITNGTVDVDRIVAKSNRNRIISFECADIQRVGRYNPKNPPVTDAAEKLLCGNPDDAYYFLVKKQGRKVLLIMSLNEKMLAAIKGSLPKNVQITLFSEI